VHVLDLDHTQTIGTLQLYRLPHVCCLFEEALSWGHCHMCLLNDIIVVVVVVVGVIPR
jgi:hypothetical protein